MKGLNTSSFLSKNKNTAVQILDILLSNKHQEKIVTDILNKAANNNIDIEDRISAIKSGKEALSVSEFTSILKEVKVQGIDTSKVEFTSFKKQKTLLSQKEFIDAVQQGLIDAEKLEKQLKELQEVAKKEQGYLKKAFIIFSKQEPISEIIQDINKFEKYCYKNGIEFNSVEKALKVGAKPKTMLGVLKDFRFLVAAAAGLITGLAGMNLMETMPAFSNIPSAFFGALPYIAVPFISLNIFKAFSEKNLMQEAGTLGRFAGTMAAGFAISLGVVGLLSGMLTPMDVSQVSDAAMNAPTTLSATGFRPTEYILHGIVAFAAFAGIYKTAKSEMIKKDKNIPKEKIGKRIKKGMMKIIFNKYTNPVIKKVGDFTNKIASKTDSAFSAYMNYLGIPAIFLMLGNTAATGNAGDFAAFGGYYTVVLAAMGTAAAALGTASYLYGCRKKEMKAIFNTVGTAFGISSSAATMPVTKENLKKMGVSEKTASSVVPLGANFNMMGTALYLGTTAAAASVMFGQELDMAKQVEIFAIVLATAFGAPGAPASNITLLDPVLHKLDLTNMQVKKMYEAVLPMDRLFDMMQTSLNVWGDMIVALGKDKREKKKLAKFKSLSR